MIDKNTVISLAEEQLKDSESFLVDVIIKPGNLIVVEIDNEEGVDIDECIKISRHIESGLDREIEDYELEVGSAGLTSPLKVLRQYQKNIGNPVEVLTKDGKKMSGILKEANEEGFVVVTTVKEKPEGSKRKIDVEHELSFKYDEIKYVKYKF